LCVAFPLKASDKIELSATFSRKAGDKIELSAAFSSKAPDKMKLSVAFLKLLVGGGVLWGIVSRIWMVLAVLWTVFAAAMAKSGRHASCIWWRILVGCAVNGSRRAKLKL
jgi:uncharacterized membrane protein YphA (DoxX/SURF4 family)